MTNRRKILAGFVFILVIVLLFTPVTVNQLKVGDYPHNIQQSQELEKNGYLYLKANLLFQRALLVVRNVMPFNLLARISPLFKQIIDIKSYDIAALVVTLLLEIGIGFVLWGFLSSKIIPIDKKWRKWLPAVMALLIMLIGPITIFTFPDRQYAGYWTGNPVHNAPFTMMKFFGVIFFVLVTETVYQKDNLKNQVIAASALVLATLAKPNISLSMLPAFFIVYGLIRYKEKKNSNLIRFTILMSSAVLLVLLSQYYIMYTGDRGESLTVAPFGVMRLFGLTIPNVLFFTLLSIAFPLATTVISWKKVKNSAAFQLAWVNFGISLLFAYLLAEQSDMASANFWWNPMLAVFLLFTVTIPIFINYLLENRSSSIGGWAQKIALWVVLGLHLFGGIAFLVYSTFSVKLLT